MSNAQIQIQCMLMYCTDRKTSYVLDILAALLQPRGKAKAHIFSVFEVYMSYFFYHHNCCTQACVFSRVNQLT